MPHSGNFGMNEYAQSDTNSDSRRQFEDAGNMSQRLPQSISRQPYQGYEMAPLTGRSNANYSESNAPRYEMETPRMGSNYERSEFSKELPRKRPSSPDFDQDSRKRAIDQRSVNMGSKSMDISLVGNLLVLDGDITPEKAEAFRLQATNSRNQVRAEDVVSGKARELVRYKLWGDDRQMYVSRAQVSTWWQHVTIMEAAELVTKYYPLTTATLPIEQILADLPFQLQIDDCTKEENTIYGFMEAIRLHEVNHPNTSADTESSWAQIIEKMLPQNHSLTSDYHSMKSSEVGPNNPTKVFMRIKRCMEYVRSINRTSARYGPVNKLYSYQLTRLRHLRDPERYSQGTEGIVAVSSEKLAQPSTFSYPALQTPRPEDRQTCRTCGHPNHLPRDCPFKNETDINTTLTGWATSPIGIKWKKMGYDSFHPEVLLRGGMKENFGYNGPLPRADAEMTRRLRGTNPEHARHNFDSEGARVEDDPIPNPWGEEEPEMARAPARQANQPNHAPGKFVFDHHNPEHQALKKSQREKATQRFDNKGVAHRQRQADERQQRETDRNQQQHQQHQQPNQFNRYNPPQGNDRREYNTVSAIDKDTPAVDFLPVLVFLKQQTTRPAAVAKDRIPLTSAPKGSVAAKVLLDTGSLAGDFVSGALVKRLNGGHYVYKSRQSLTVCSGLDNTCYENKEMIDVGINFATEKNKNMFIFLSARISSFSKIDIIIGRNSLKKFNFFQMTPSHFVNSCTIKECWDESAATLDKQPEVLRTHSKSEKSLIVAASGAHTAHTNVCNCHSLQTVALLEESSAATDTSTLSIKQPLKDTQPAQRRRVRFVENHHEGGDTQHPPQATTITQQTVLAAATEPAYIHQRSLDSGDEIDYEATDTFAPFVKNTLTEQQANFLDSITFEGSIELQKKCKELCLEFRDIFSDTLGSSPAKIEPFDIKVNLDEWETPKNRGQVRTQSRKHNEEIRLHVTEMLKSGVIEPSPAVYYNHPVIVSKTDGKSRFCVDYRNLNNCTLGGSWPIPNIRTLFERIGGQEPDTFGVMDLTSGYHQAPITAQARIFTAFICFSGIYQFTRLPFGPKRAPSYFQEKMASVVLFGLMYLICELYLDDCIVFAKGDEQFVQRLRKVFIAFRKSNVLLKAKKCKFGTPKIEYVGKVISRDGLTMSADKIATILDFPKPVQTTSLRSFLGLANYFRDFVPNHSNTVSPLHKMIDNSAKKKTPVVWTPEGVLAFEKIRELISLSPLLYFVNETAPITLMTDASDYGIGGYLFQKVKGVDQPVAFVSKSLSEVQLRWSVIQKEAFAIFFCCTKLSHLLRDRTFMIKTDHRNLTFLKNDSNAMVVRWSIALQEFDFQLEFVPGVENAIADAMSRLCPNLMTDTSTDVDTSRNIETLSAIMAVTPVPLEERDIIASCHNHVVGHGGVERTILKLLSLKHNWKNMRQQVKLFIKNCACCQKMSVIKIPIHAAPFTTSTYTPMECLNIDFVGPFPDKGYILVIIDTFTRWTELFACAEATAIAAANGLLAHFGRFGSPQIIRSDRGSHFANALIEEFLHLVGVKQNLTLAYSSEENAIVERVNKEVNRHLRAFVYETCSVENYQQSIPFVQRIINAAQNHRLKLSPAQLLFGNQIELDRGILLPFPERQESQISMSLYLANMLSSQDRLNKIAVALLKQDDFHHMTSVDTDITHFDVGTLVLVQRRGDPPTRLHTKWMGPQKILSHHASEYLLLDLVNGKQKLYHVTSLRQFRFDPQYVTPTDVARRDYLEFFVEHIREHRGDFRKPSSMTFEVKWLNFDDSHNSWEPWANLRNTDALHRYLRLANLARLIPKEFR